MLSQIIEEIPNDKNLEHLDQKIEGSSKEIENKEDKRALLSENKHNRDKANIKHIEVNIKGVKNQVTMKTKKIGKTHQRKLINTWEGLDMIKSGLVNVLNLPITDQREIINFKHYRRSLIEIFEGTHNKTVSKNLNKSIFTLNIPGKEMHNTRSVNNHQFTIQTLV